MISVRRLDPPFWGLAFPFSRAVLATVKAIPGMAWSPESRMWVGYLDAAATAIEHLRRAGARVNGNATVPESTIPLLVASAGLRDYQKTGVDFLISKSPEGAILSDDLGLGKQQPIDARVLTPAGYRPLGDIRIGDLVLGSSGRSTRVVGIFPQGVKPSYRVRLSDGTSVETGPEHLWAVDYYRGGRELQRIVVTTDQIRRGSTIETQWAGGAKRMCLGKTKLYIPMLRGPALFKPIDALPIPPYTLGQLIANGYLARRQTTLTVNTKDWPEIHKMLEAEGVAVGAVQAYGGATRVGVIGLVPHIAELGLAVLSARKHIPEMYLRAAPSDRVAFLQGLMDGDGSCSAKRNRLTYHTTGRRLAEGVVDLVECLGGRAKIRPYDRTSEGKPLEFQVAIRLPSDIPPFRISRKLSRYSPISRIEPTRSVVAVSYVRKVESVCIAVDAPDHLYVTEHAILTHNTCQAATAARALKLKTAIVCPAFVKGVWEDELKRWWPAAVVKVISGVKPSPLPEDADVIVINYDVLHAWLDALRAWGAAVVVFDEGHFLMSAKARRTIASKALAETCRYRMMLTGTPMTSRPRDLWAPVDVISPGRFGTRPFPFYKRYCDAKQEQVTPTKVVWKFDGASNLEELNRRLLRTPETPWGFMLRRLKSDVALELPPRTRQVIEVPVKKANVIYPTEWGNAQLRKALDAAADGKIAPAIDLIESHLEQGHKVVAFTHRKAVAWEIAEGIRQRMPKQALVITGDVGQAERKLIVAQKPDLLAATMDSTGVGIDLSFADVAVFVELDWVPSKLVQAEGRLHRFGQQRAVLIQYLIARASADDLIRRAVLGKLDAFEKAIGKTDDRLAKDLAGLEKTGAQRLKELYERLKIG